MRPKLLFVDTAGWIAQADAADSDHARTCAARDQWLESGGLLVSSDYVLDETLTLLRVRLGLQAAERWWNQVEGSRRLRWEWVDAQRCESARNWFFRWSDKTFSFTDCTSFVLMKELRIRQALTLDRHFQQAGFDIVPA
jgi:predicted nucleic acid-binding protein